MRQLNVEMKGTSAHEVVDGIYKIERRAGEGSPWVVAETIRIRSNKPEAKRQFLLEDNERVVIEGDDVEVLIPLPSQNSATTLKTWASYPGNELPTVTGLTPDTAVIGDPDVAMTVAGTGFVEGKSVILFNGGEEPTTFISATALSTTIRPSTAGTAGAFPVAVKTGLFTSNDLDFTFTDPVVAMAMAAKAGEKSEPAKPEVAKPTKK